LITTLAPFMKFRDGSIYWLFPVQLNTILKRLVANLTCVRVCGSMENQRLVKCIDPETTDMHWYARTHTHTHTHRASKLNIIVHAVRVRQPLF